jgi:hypothetical protein
MPEDKRSADELLNDGEAILAKAAQEVARARGASTNDDLEADMEDYDAAKEQADAGEEESDEGQEEPQEDEGEEEKPEMDPRMMAKAEGADLSAVDATPILEALDAKIARLEAVEAKLDGLLVKADAILSTQGLIVKAQGLMVKAQGQLSGTPIKAKSKVSVPTKVVEPQVNKQAIFAKAAELADIHLIGHVQHYANIGDVEGLRKALPPEIRSQVFPSN